MRIARLESRSTRDRPVLLVALVATAAFALALAPAAHADIGETIILRCTHEESLSGFSQSAYAKALKELSADTEEYSDCSSRIRQAQLAAAGGHGAAREAAASSAQPTSLAATPSEQLAIAHAKHLPARAVRLGGQLVEPGVVHANIASAFSSLPTPLFATLAFLILCLLLVLAGALRNRVRARRPG
jgi:hypothetical protein